MREGSKLVRYVSLVRQVWLEDLVGISSDRQWKKVIIDWVEQDSDGWNIIAAVPERFGATKYVMSARKVFYNLKSAYLPKKHYNKHSINECKENILHCVLEKTSPFYISDKLVKCHLILSILGRNMPWGIFN